MKLFFYGLTLSLLWVFTQANAQNGVTSKTVQIGLVLPFSGDMSELGLSYFKGAQACAKSVNEASLISRKIVLMPLNDINDANESLQVSKEALSSKEASEQVFALMGLAGDSVAEALLPFAISQHVPVVGVLAGSEKVTQYTGGQGVFTSRLDDLQQFEAMIKQLVAMKQFKYGLVVERSASGLKKMQTMQSLATKHGASIVSVVEFVSGDTATEFKSAAFLASQPNAIISLVGYSTTLNLMKTMRAAKYTGIFAAPSSIGPRTMVLRGGKALVHGLVVSFPQVLTADSTLAVVRDYRKRVQSSVDDLAYDDAAFEGCIAVQILAEGLRRVGGNLTRDTFKAALNARPVQLNELTMQFGNKPMQMNFPASTSMVGADGNFIK